MSCPPLSPADPPPASGQSHGPSPAEPSSNPQSTSNQSITSFVAPASTNPRLANDTNTANRPTPASLSLDRVVSLESEQTGQQSNKSSAISLPTIAQPMKGPNTAKGQDPALKPPAKLELLAENHKHIGQQDQIPSSAPKEQPKLASDAATQSSRKSTNAFQYWSNQERQKLKQLCEAYFGSQEAGNPPYTVNEHWERVAAQLKGRNAAGCRKRWQRDMHMAGMELADADTNLAKSPDKYKHPGHTAAPQQVSIETIPMSTDPKSTDPNPSRSTAGKTKTSKLVATGEQARRWGVEEDKHYMRLVKEKRASSSYIDATNREVFWGEVQAELAQLGFTRSIASLRCRWGIKLNQADLAQKEARGSPGRRRQDKITDSDEDDSYEYIIGSSQTVSARSSRKRHRTRDPLWDEHDDEIQGFSLESYHDGLTMHQPLSTTKEPQGSLGTGNTSRADTERRQSQRNTRGTSKLLPGFVDFQDVDLDSSDDDSSMGAPPPKKTRLENNHKPKVEPQTSIPTSKELNAAAFTTNPRASTAKPTSHSSTATPQPLADADDQAFARRKIATLNNDIQILSIQKNGHLLILEDAETRLAQVVQKRAKIEQKLKKLAARERELGAERDFKNRELAEVEEHIQQKEKGRVFWTQGLDYC